MTRNTLYIHIGHYKTGTTALQAFLNKNANRLAQSGVQYAPYNYFRNKHSAYAFSILRDAGVTKLMHGYKNPTPAAELWQDLFSRVRASRHPTTLISSEEFIRIGEYPPASQKLLEIARARPDIDVKIIAYLRNPQAHLKSWHNQLVKMGISIPEYDRAILGGVEDIHINYARALAPWAEAFGPQNLIVRQYFGTSKGSNYIFEDFMSVISPHPPEDLAYPHKDPNPPMDTRMAELMRLMQNLGLPQKTMERLRTRSKQYFAQQDQIATNARQQIEDVQAEARAGINWLATLPEADLDLDDFADNLPEPFSGDTVQTNLLLGFILSELIALRQRLNNHQIKDMETRLKKLEQKLNRS
jgi:hypothetical protein